MMTILKLIRFALRRQWSQPPFGRLDGLRHLNARYPFKPDKFRGKSVLIVSIPRGGSSWVGKMIGGSEHATYLREPITQSYRKFDKDHGAYFELSHCKDPTAYLGLANLAFSRFGGFPDNITTFKEQWPSIFEKPKVNVVKEVNPLVAHDFAKRYDLKVIYLIRHPAAVAFSMKARGWVANPFPRKFTEARLREVGLRFSIPNSGDFWENAGAIQAITQRLVMERMESVSDKKIVLYEDLCREPLEIYKDLFNYCEIPFTSDDESRIRKSSQGSGRYEVGKYDTNRDSVAMADKWKKGIEKKELEAVERGYLKNQPLKYLDSEWWVS